MGYGAEMIFVYNVILVATSMNLNVNAKLRLTFFTRSLYRKIRKW